jgi:hypothetical protein
VADTERLARPACVPAPILHARAPECGQARFPEYHRGRRCHRRDLGSAIEYRPFGKHQDAALCVGRCGICSCSRRRRVFLSEHHARFAGCISAVILVRSWSADTSALISFRDSIAADPSFAAQSRFLSFHLAVTTDTAYPVNSLRNIALDNVPTSHVRIYLPALGHPPPPHTLLVGRCS